MLFLSLLITLMLSLVSNVATFPVNASLDVAVAGYETSVATFIGTIFGEEYELKGTVESVHQQLQDNYPGDDIIEELRAEINHMEAELDSSDLEELRDKNGLICSPVPGQSFALTQTDSVQNAIHDLWRVGRVRINARSCARVACARGWQVVIKAMVHVCNDRYDAIEPDMKYIHSYVGDIFLKCKGAVVQWPSPGPYRWWTGRQAFDSDGYNVVLQNSPTC